MKRYPILKISFFLIMTQAIPEVANAVNSLFVYYREPVSLNGDWHIIIDPYENGYYNYRMEPFDQMNQPWATGYFGDKKPESPSDLIEYDYDISPVLHVPGDWNTQDPRLFFYEGTVWYRKKFDAPKTDTGKRFFLYFGAVNYRADVYLNAKKLGMHLGGFTPFWFEVTGLLKEKDNSLIVKVDNKRLKEGVPTLNTDWWNYGGITRDVKLIVVPRAFVNDYSIAFESVSSKQIYGKVFLDGGIAGEKVTISIPELKIEKTILANERGEANYRFTAKNVILWTPEHPKLYRIEITSGSDQIIDSVGFRTIAVKGKQLLLNDQPVFLKGVSIHEEYAVYGGGRVKDVTEAEQLFTWAKELGCNFVRLAHYPHNEDMVRIAEKMGIMVWSEIPVYWTIDWENEGTYLNAEKQLEDNILRDRNRANIIIWSLANETPINNPRTLFLTKLAQRAKKLDSTRLLSAAMEKHYISDSIAVVEDPLADIVDIVAFNEYIGWYDGLPDKCMKVSWQIPYDKPVFISEFGGGAKYGLHGNSKRRWTEEFQEDLYRQSLRMIGNIEGLCGISPWILVDFRSPRRPLPGIQDYFNRKGLLSEKGERKKAFFVLQQYYKQKNPFKNSYN
jgi:beta-glucuronidase